MVSIDSIHLAKVTEMSCLKGNILNYAEGIKISCVRL